MRYYDIMNIPILLVAVFITALVVGIPVEAISLFLSLVQTIISIISLMDYEEGFSMTNSMLVVSGTHGVVRVLGEDICCYKCRVGSNPARSAI